MDVEKRIAAGNEALAALMRRRNVNTAARLTFVHYVGTNVVLQKENERKMHAVEMRSLCRI